MKDLKGNLFHNYVLYLVKSLKVFCFFEILEPINFEKLNLDKTVLLKFRETFGKTKFRSITTFNKLRWSGFIYLLGGNDLKAFCISLEKIFKITQNVIFYHFYFQDSKMVINEFFLLLLNKFNLYFRLLQLLFFYNVVLVLYFSLVKKVNNLLLLKTCQH